MHLVDQGQGHRNGNTPAASLGSDASQSGDNNTFDFVTMIMSRCLEFAQCTCPWLLVCILLAFAAFAAFIPTVNVNCVLNARQIALLASVDIRVEHQRL